jgi:hypothetical protein
LRWPSDSLAWSVREHSARRDRINHHEWALVIVGLDVYRAGGNSGRALRVSFLVMQPFSQSDETRRPGGAPRLLLASRAADRCRFTAKSHDPLHANMLSRKAPSADRTQDRLRTAASGRIADARLGIKRGKRRAYVSAGRRFCAQSLISDSPLPVALLIAPRWHIPSTGNMSGAKTRDNVCFVLSKSF